MSRWLIFRPEFCPCLLHAIKREGPFGYTALILLLICFATAIGLTIDCLVDLFNTGNEPFYEIIATVALYILCGLIFLIFGNILLKTIREEIAEIDRVRREPQAVFYRPLPNEDVPVDEEEGAQDSDSSGNQTNPSGYVSADLGAISDGSESLSGASRSTAAASRAASAASGYASAEPEIEVAALSSPRTFIIPGSLSSTQVIQTQPRATRFVAWPAQYLSTQTQPVAIRTQPRALPSVHRAYRQQIGDSGFRSGLESVRDSAVYVYEELEVERSQSSPEEFREIAFPEEEAFNSIEEMRVRLVRRPIHSRVQEEQPRTSSDSVEDEAYRTNSGI